MVDRGAVRSALIEQLRPRSFKPVDGLPDETDIYLELGINGADLWEIFVWAHKSYGTDFSGISSKHYNINEPPALSFKETFKPVTIRQMLEAVEQGHWVVPE